MKHHLLNLFLFLILFVSSAAAQETTNRWRLGASLNPGLLTNTFSHFVIGSDISLEKHLSGKLEAVVSAGITHYADHYYNYSLNVSNTGALDVKITATDRNVVPVQAGLKLYPAGHFYIGGKAGAGFGLNGTTSFVYTPSLGFSLDNGVDLGVKYDNYNSREIRDVLSLKLGYRFKL